MSKYIKWILILALWFVILFYGHELGASVILYMIPLLSFIYYFLKENDKINNKKGLLFFIPMLLLSFTYMLFDNGDFAGLNVLVLILMSFILIVFNFSSFIVSLHFYSKLL